MKVTIQDSRTSVTVEPRDFRVTVSGARGPAGPAGANEWGEITGDIIDQTDLYNALEDKVPYTGATGDVNLGEHKLMFANASELREGTYDFGGQGGISQICSVGFENNWQSGFNHIFDNNGLIRESLHCFDIVPDSSFDSSLRFKIGSLWKLDDGTIYECVDATIGAAVWQLYNPYETDISGLVPYTGATADVNLGEYGAQLGNLEFDNTPTNVPTTAGSVYWNDTDGTLNMVLKGGQTISRIGETQHIRALNNTGAQIARGKVVYVVGAQGQRLTIALADADTEILSKDTIGFTAEAIADGAEGFVIVQGVINNISTTGMTDGATVYLSQTAGSYTTTPPADPAHLVILGFIVNGGSGGAGSIYVKVDNGYELEELHNVSNSAKTTPVADDALFLRDSADNNLWKRLTWTNALAGVKTHMDTFKSVSGGYASLDGSGKVPSNELPSYVDDVVEVANYAALPVTGETGKIYVTIDTNKCYRWSGSAYIQVAQGVDTLTTTGTSGAATLVGSTLNIPQYQSVLTNPVTGTGTAGQVSYWSGTGTQTGSADFTWNDTTKILSFSNGGALINEIRVGSINTNTIIGRLAGSSPSLTGANNSFFGQSAGRNNSTGNQNSIFGSSAGLNNTTGANNSFFGREAGRNNTTGGSNSFFGLSAGQYIANGSNLTVANNSVFLGFDTRAAADSQTNQTVIGYQAIGLGSNTTVIGNSSTTLTWLGGSTSIGTTDSSARLHVRGSGTTSSTTALLVQNSTATELFKVADNGNANFGTGMYWDNVNNRLGLGESTPTSRLHLVQTDTGTSTLIGYQNSITSTPTANKSTATYGASFETTIAGTFQSTNVLSFQARVNVTSNNVNNQVRGLLGRVTTSATGNAFSAIGVQSLIEHNSTGTITSAYGLSISNIVNSGTITNTYGIYIGDMTTGTQTNTPYAIYSEDASAISYLAGSTSIGTTTSSARLHVRGSGTTSATTALLVQNSTPSELFKVLDNGAWNFNGDGIVKGSGNTSGTTALTVQNSDGTTILTVRNDNRVIASNGFRVGGILTSAGIFPDGGTTNFEGLLIRSSNGQDFTGTDITISNGQGNGTATSGTRTLVGISRGFAPTSGTGVWNTLSITSTINQTGGANGITRGLYVNPTLTAAADWRSVETSNNTGWAVYTAGTANSYFGGNVGIGATSLSNINLRILRPLTGLSVVSGVAHTGVIQSDVTSEAIYYNVTANVVDSVFTLASLRHFNAQQGTWGVNPTVTNQYGFSVNSNLIGATNNYGFYGNIPSGTGRWNLYMNGTAANYLAGNTSIGTTTSGGRLTVQGSGTTSSTKALVVNNATPTAIFEILDNGRINQTIPGVTFNTIFGTGAGASASLSGAHNTIFGTNAGQNNTTAAANTLIGSGAGAGVTTGGSNIYIGRDAGSNNQTSSLNTAIGVFAMLNHNTGTHNIVIGFNSARYLADGTTNATSFDSCVYLGNSIKVTSSGVSNEIILGFNAIGNGSNTATLGNTSITNTYLRGNINYTDGGNFVIGTTTGTKIGTATSQKIGFWNATPIVQPTTGVAAATRVGGGGTTVTDTDTFDGYTIAQLVKALRNMGALE